MTDWDGLTDADLASQAAELAMLLQDESEQQARDLYDLRQAVIVIRKRWLGKRHVNILVPYLSQWGEGANRSPGDCGPACAAMLVHHYTDQRPTVDEVAIAAGQPEGSHYTTLTQLTTGAAHYGLTLKWHRPILLDDIRAELDAARPILMLIHYGALPDRLDQNYTGGHFVLVVGYGHDEGGAFFLINDPDWWGPRRDEGDHWRITPDELGAAISQCHLDGNRDNQGLLVVR